MAVVAALLAVVAETVASPAFVVAVVADVAADVAAAVAVAVAASTMPWNSEVSTAVARSLPSSRWISFSRSMVSLMLTRAAFSSWSIFWPGCCAEGCMAEKSVKSKMRSYLSGGWLILRGRCPRCGERQANKL